MHKSIMSMLEWSSHVVLVVILATQCLTGVCLDDIDSRSHTGESVAVCYVSKMSRCTETVTFTFPEPLLSPVVWIYRGGD